MLRDMTATHAVFLLGEHDYRPPLGSLVGEARKLSGVREFLLRHTRNRQELDGGRETIKTNRCGLPPWKRGLDFALILVVSPALLLIGVAVALIIKLGSPGPVFFRQKRVGYKGREFTIFKFRTMRT